MIVISKKTGQLGNRLFNFANFIGYGESNKVKVLNPSFDEYAEYFEGTSSTPLIYYPKKRYIPGFLNTPKLRHIAFRLASSYASRWIKKRGLEKKYIVSCPDNEFSMLNLDDQMKEKVRSNSMTFVSGLNFRDIPSIKEHIKKIRDYFRPLKHHRDNIAKVVDNARAQCDVLVGVHIRQGDYANHLDGRYFFSNDDFISMMRQVKSLFPQKRVGFLLCSDAKIDHHIFDEFSCFYGPNHVVEDMYTLAECDYIIGPPSTYSLWACLYGDKKLYVVQNPKDVITEETFRDYFSIVGSMKILKRPDNSEYVVINGAEYNLSCITGLDSVPI